MLNKHGKGTICLGINDNGDVVGMKDDYDDVSKLIAEKIMSQIEPKIYPTIQKIENGLNWYIEITFEGGETPYSADGRYFMRVGTTNRELTRAELSKMMRAEYTTSEQKSIASTNTVKRKGLLLGAGFSMELGMPSAQEFSRAFYSFLTPNKLRIFADRMKANEPYGSENPTCKNEYENIYNTVVRYRDEGNFNYEFLLREIRSMPYNGIDIQNFAEVQRTRDYFRNFLNSLINGMFRIFQANTYSIFQANKEHYKFLLDSFCENETWVFSLNHDIIIEMLCIDLKIQLYMGDSKTLQFPFDNYFIEGNKPIRFGEIDNKESKLDSLNFAKGSKGINLIKLHGGLNEFIHDDEKKRLFFSIIGYKSSEDYLKDICLFIDAPHYYIHGQPVKNSEIIVSDYDGVMQFLTPSILSGDAKFSPATHDGKGEPKMAQFSLGIENLDELYIIGYGFGDPHINNRIVRAMHINPNMKIWTVDPFNSRPTLLDSFDYNLRVRGIHAKTTQAIYHLKTETWHTPDETETLDSVWEQRTKIYEHLYNIVFKRD